MGLIHDEFESPTENINRKSRAGKSPSFVRRILGYLIGQILALAVFVGFPVLVTWSAPVSWIEFCREGETVSAKTKTCLLFVVPFRTSHVDSVTAVSRTTIAGSVTRTRRPGKDRVTKEEDKGVLVITGLDNEIEVLVSPVNLESVLEQSQGFLEDADQSRLELFVVANWKFSVIMGGLCSLLTVIYVVTIGLGLLLKSIHAAQWSIGIPAHRRLFASVLADSKKWVQNQRRTR